MLYIPESLAFLGLIIFWFQQRTNKSSSDFTFSRRQNGHNNFLILAADKMADRKKNLLPAKIGNINKNINTKIQKKKLMLNMIKRSYP